MTLLPTGVLQEILDTYHRFQRGQEELKLIDQEVKNVCRYLLTQLNIIDNLITNNIMSKKLQSGQLALLIRKGIYLEKSYLILVSYFKENDLPLWQLKYYNGMPTDNEYASEDEEDPQLPYDSSDSEDEFENEL